MSQWTDAEIEEYNKRRAAGGALAGALGSNSSMLSSFISGGGTAKASTNDDDDEFVEADKYEGSQPGFVFKMGRFGLGYYTDKGPMAPKDDFDVNASLAPPKEYDMEAHARGDEPEKKPKEPGEGRVGTLGELLAENKAKKQEQFEEMVHANRYCPPKALDEDEEAFLMEKDGERRAAERARKESEKEASNLYRMAVAQQDAKKGDDVNLAKLMGQAKEKKKPDQNQKGILSRMVAVKRKGAGDGDEGPAKQAKVEPPKAAEAPGAALMGLGDYGSDDDSD